MRAGARKRREGGIYVLSAPVRYWHTPQGASFATLYEAWGLTVEKKSPVSGLVFEITVISVCRSEAVHTQAHTVVVVVCVCVCVCARACVCRFGTALNAKLQQGQIRRFRIVKIKLVWHGIVVKIHLKYTHVQQ